MNTEPVEEGTGMGDPRRMVGLLLIAGGLLWALIAITDLDGTVVVPGVGMVFLVAYLVTRRYGLLIPGGIVTGLGIGLVVAAQGGPGEAVVLGLGLGFVAITAFDAMLGDGGAAWWPLIPGGILTVVGASQIAGIHDIGIYLVPAALIVVGLLMLLRPSRNRRDPASPKGASTTEDPTDPPSGDRGEQRP